jgi:putative transposase
MKGKKHSPDQIIAKLREADGLLATGATIAHIRQKLAIREQTFHR